MLRRTELTLSVDEVLLRVLCSDSKTHNISWIYIHTHVYKNQRGAGAMLSSVLAE